LSLIASSTNEWRGALPEGKRAKESWKCSLQDTLAGRQAGLTIHQHIDVLLALLNAAGFTPQQKPPAVSSATQQP